MSASWSHGPVDIRAELRAMKDRMLQQTAYQPPQPQVLYVGPKTYAWVQAEAEKRGLTVDEYAAQLICKEVFAGLERVGE